MPRLCQSILKWAHISVKLSIVNSIVVLLHVLQYVLDRCTINQRTIKQPGIWWPFGQCLTTSNKFTLFISWSLIQPDYQNEKWTKDCIPSSGDFKLQKTCVTTTTTFLNIRFLAEWFWTKSECSKTLFETFLSRKMLELFEMWKKTFHLFLWLTLYHCDVFSVAGFDQTYPTNWIVIKIMVYFGFLLLTFLLGFTHIFCLTYNIV